MKDLLNIPAETLQSLGIVDWGYTTETLPRSFSNFEIWAKEAKEHLPFLVKDKASHYRSDLKAWYPEAQSALVFLFSYAPTKKAMLKDNFYRVAGYSLGFNGEDYHPIVKSRIAEIAKLLKEQNSFEWKFTHDTEPVLERDLAFRAGLGWFGKNSMLISRQHGSYFIIGSLILNRSLPIENATVDTDHCGQCRLCVDACPTDAIEPTTRTIKVKDCISTWSIEDRSGETSAPKGTENGRGEIFGCDICQDVCPWNGKPVDKIEPHLSEASKKWIKFFSRDLKEIVDELSLITNRGYLRLMDNTVFGRPGRPSLLRTLTFWMKR